MLETLLLKSPVIGNWRCRRLTGGTLVFDSLYTYVLPNLGGRMGCGGIPQFPSEITKLGVCVCVCVCVCVLRDAPLVTAPASFSL